MTAQQERKHRIRTFMGKYYSDDRLAMLLAHATDGRLAHHSCCCFVGVVTASHALQSQRRIDELEHNPFSFEETKWHPDFVQASQDYCWLGRGDDASRRIIIPMIRAEMRRREKLRTQTELRQELTQELELVAR